MTSLPRTSLAARPALPEFGDSLIDAAAHVSAKILASDPGRLAHSAGVAVRAAQLAVTVDAWQGPRLVTAAWLHDVGYALELRDTGFHPLDGARALRARGWPHDVVRLVAHHSGSDFVAAARGLRADLAEFPPLPGALADALTAADQTTGPDGRPMGFEERLRGMLRRHGPDSPNARVHPWRGPYLRSVVRRVAHRLRVVGRDPAEYGLAG